MLYFNTWGGGGWGDPTKRDAQLVALDVKRGLVTAEGARRYGVVVKDGKVDASATDRLRAEMSGKTKSTGLFNRGVTSIDELKKRCKAETGFDAPKAPVFRNQVRMAAE
jgi:N-methylhydantoinase B